MEPENNTDQPGEISVTNAAPAASPAAAEATLPNVPSSWPGAFELFKYSKQAVKVNLGVLIIVWVVNILLSGGMEWKLQSKGQILSLVIGGLMTAITSLLYLTCVRQQKVSLGQAVSNALPFWLKMIGLNILTTLSLIVSAVLLIVPLFFVLPRLVLAPYFLVDKKMGIIEAYKASWAATKGNALKIWGIFGVNILMCLLMITIIGIPFAIYFLIMYSAAFAVFYEFVNKAQPVAATAAVPATTPPSPIEGDPVPATPSEPPTPPAA